MANIKACMSHATDEWGTPKEMFEYLDSIWKFNLDVCASPENHKCGKWFDKVDNAMELEWKDRNDPGRCFMNPPFSLLKKFCKKARDEVLNGNALFVVALLPARTDTKAFHEFIYGQADVEFLKGRLKFVGAKYQAPFPSMIVTWRKKWK